MMRWILLPLIFVSLVMLGGTAYIHAYAGRAYSQIQPRLSATLPKYSAPEDALPLADAERNFLRDPWNVFFLLVGAGIGSLTGFLAKSFMDKTFAKEITEWNLWKRGAFVFVSFGTSLCSTPEAIFRFYPPPSDPRILGLTFFIALSSWVILEVIFSDVIRKFIQARLGVPAKPEEATGPRLFQGDPK